MEKTTMLYEGKAKKVFATDDPSSVIVEYKDDATAFNGLKKGTIVGKGVVNNKVSNHMFRMLEAKGIPTHYVEEISDRETIVKKVEIVKIEVIVRNIAAGSLSERIGLPEGTKLPVTVLEYCLKEEMEKISSMALKINEIMRDYLKEVNVDLIDFKLEFGRFDGDIILADEISPDTCRFWDSKTGMKLDKDRFRRDLGGVEDAYQEILHRLMGGSEA